MDKIGTGCLITIILVLIFYGGKYTQQYYSGKQYVVDKYVEALKNKDYEQIYNLIDQSEIQVKMNKNELVNYYNYYYEEYKPLINVQKCGWKEDRYIISMILGNNKVIDDLEVIKSKSNKWKVKFPFEYSDLSITAPVGAEVKINEEILAYNNQNKYVRDNMLPGKYLLRIDFAKEGVDDYTKVIEMPVDKDIDLPYQVGNLKVDVAGDLKIKISDLQLQDVNIGNSIKDILVGEYEVTVFQPDGYIDPITKKINIVEGNNNLCIDQYTLSSKGNSKLAYFMKEFYQNYNKAIMQHERQLISGYFKEENDISEFEEWYINNKDIANSEVFYEFGGAKVDELGNLNVQVLEVVNLDNNQDDSTKQYKVVISWDVCIDIMSHEWNIINRTLKESVVAVRDYEGKWVQY